MLPQIFSRLSERKTPTAAILLCGAACCIDPFFGRGVLVWLVDAASFGCVVAYFIVSLSFCILRVKEPDMVRPYKVQGGMVVGVLAVFLTGFMAFLYVVPSPFSSALLWQEWVVVGAWILLGILFYFYSRKKYGKEFGHVEILELDDNLK